MRDKFITPSTRHGADSDDIVSGDIVSDVSDDCDVCDVSDVSDVSDDCE